MQPCPEASFDTGLDLFGLRRLRHRLDAAPPAPDPGRASRGRAGGDLLQLHDDDGFVLRADRPLAFQVDGDDLGDRT